MKLPSHINTDPNRERKRPPMLLRWWRKIITLHGSPREIALGVGIGMFIALSPTVGLQMLLGLIVATIVGASRPAAVITCWITNIFTIPPIYAATYFLGALVWPGASASFSDAYGKLFELTDALEKVRPWDFWTPMVHALEITGEMFMPMVIGGIIAGAVLGPISYIITLRSVRRYRRMRGKLRHRVRLARKAAKEAKAAKALGGPTASEHVPSQAKTDEQSLAETISETKQPESNESHSSDSNEQTLTKAG